MKKIIVLAAALVVAASSCACAAPIVLPEPQKSGGIGLFDALSKRSSAAQSNFAKDELSLNELSTLLWATTGKNREPKGWTVPLAMGREPYISVYVLLSSGAYSYSWEENALIEVNDDKKILHRAPSQDFAKSAPCVLVFVDPGALNMKTFAAVAAGAMSQNAYLAAESLGLKARFLGSFNRSAIEESLRLSLASEIIGLMAVGRQ